MIKVGRVGHPRASECVSGAIYVVLAAKAYELLVVKYSFCFLMVWLKISTLGPGFQMVMVSLDGAYMSKNLFVLSSVIRNVFSESSDSGCVSISQFTCAINICALLPGFTWF